MRQSILFLVRAQKSHRKSAAGFGLQTFSGFGPPARGPLQYVQKRSWQGEALVAPCPWIQQYVKDKKLEAASIPTKYNVSDTATKKLSCDRMKCLMNTAGVYDMGFMELVGTMEVQRQQQHDE